MLDAFPVVGKVSIFELRYFHVYPVEKTSRQGLIVLLHLVHVDQLANNLSHKHSK